MIEKPKINYSESKDQTSATFTLEPLEKGFGTTLGNALRRTLLSGLPGAAPIAVRIEGVLHEFSSIVGVYEDVTDIILNLKALHVKTHNTDADFQTVIRLEKKGAGEIKASDISAGDQVEILNPDLHICTLEEKASISMEIVVGRGRGYIDANDNKSKIDDIGFIAIDSIFTPVRSADYHVSAARKGESLDYDKLVLNVKTNGTIKPKEITGLSAKILHEHVRLFLDLAENIPAGNILEDEDDAENSELLSKNIDELNLSVRSYNALINAGIAVIGDITQRTEDEMLQVKNLGRKSLDDIIKKIQDLGLSLNKEDI